MPGKKNDKDCAVDWASCTSNGQCCSGFCTDAGLCTVHPNEMKDCFNGWRACYLNEQCCSGYCTLVSQELWLEWVLLVEGHSKMANGK